MENSQNFNFVKDIKILDERTVPSLNQQVKLIVGKDDGNQILDLQIKRAVNFEKMVTFKVNDIAYAPELSARPYNSARNILLNIRDKLLKTQLLLSPPLEYQESIFDCRHNISPNNIAHLMLEIIPLCLHVKKLAGQNTKFLFTNISPQFIKLLEAFNIEPVNTKKNIRGSIVKIFGTRELAAYNLLEVKNAHLITFFSDIYADYKFANPLKVKEKLFICRRDARGLINQEAIESILNKLGYQTVFMENYTMQEKLGIASEAKDIVAMHGAAIGLLAVNKQINSLIEICPPNNYYDYYAASLAGCVKKHIQIIPSFDANVAYSGWDAIVHFKNRSFYVQEDQIKLALSMID